MIRIIVIVISLSALGFLIYLLFSKDQKPWYAMTEEQKRKKKIMIVSATTVFLAGLISTLLTGKKK